MRGGVRDQFLQYLKSSVDPSDLAIIPPGAIRFLSEHVERFIETVYRSELRRRLDDLEADRINEELKNL